MIPITMSDTYNRVIRPECAMFWMCVLLTATNCVPVTKDIDDVKQLNDDDFLLYSRTILSNDESMLSNGGNAVSYSGPTDDTVLINEDDVLLNDGTLLSYADKVLLSNGNDIVVIDKILPTDEQVLSIDDNVLSNGDITLSSGDTILSDENIEMFDEYINKKTDGEKIMTRGVTNSTNGQTNLSGLLESNDEKNKETRTQNTLKTFNNGTILDKFQTSNKKYIVGPTYSLLYTRLRRQVKETPVINDKDGKNVTEEFREKAYSRDETVEASGEMLEISGEVDESPDKQRPHYGLWYIPDYPKLAPDSLHNTHGDDDNNANGKASRKGREEDKDKRGAIYDDGDPPTINVDLSMVDHDFTGLSREVLYQKHGGVCRAVIGYGRGPIYMISDCPFRTTDHTTRHLCENSAGGDSGIIDILDTPVQDGSGFVYRNVYCAQCAGATRPVAWTTSMICDDMRHMEISDGKEKISLMRHLGETSMGCKKLLRPAYPSHVLYCDDIYNPEVEASSKHRTRVGDNGKDVSPLPLSFFVLMNFGFDGKTHILFSTAPEQLVQTACQQTQIYDPTTDKCREMSCPDGYRLIDGICGKVGNVESDPTPGDFNFNANEDTYQVTLTVKNVTYAELFLFALPGIEDMLKASLAEMFNISKDRIGNLTVNVANNTNAINDSLSTEIEVHKFVMDKPSAGIEHSPKKADGDKHIDYAIEPTAPIREETRIRHSTIPVNVCAGHAGLSDGHVEDEIPENNDSLSKNGTRNRLHTTDKDTKSFSDATNTPAVNQSFNHDATLWNTYLGISLKISFLLKPPHRMNSEIEKSAKSVVESMTAMINKQDFMLTVNGTDFQVDALNPAPTSMDKFCTRGSSQYYDDDEFEMVSVYNNETHTNDTHVVVMETRAQFGVGEYDLTISVEATIGNLSHAKIVSFVIVCVMPKIENLQCGRIILSSEEYIMFENYSIKFSDRVFTLQNYEYVDEDNGTLRICAPDWRELRSGNGVWALACGEDMMKVVVAESYLSFILGAISLVAMLSVLLTYGLFEKLRNLPGVNTINLTLSLLLGELVFISSGWLRPQQAWLCSGVGILLHFLFLASFFWMNVMSYDVYRTFATKCILKRIRDKKKYVPRYAIYAWGCPMLIVAVCAFLDFTNYFSDVSIGYGGIMTSNNDGFSSNGSSVTSTKHVYSIGCWIHEPVASMAAFGGPMMLILLSNVVMFTRTIICIRSSTKMTKHSVRRSSQSHVAGHDDVMLYIRMSTVMGFTWVFGLASSLVSAFADTASKATCLVLHVIAILFIVFNCSQGIFIFCAFVFNRRVLTLYKCLFLKMRKGRERPLSVSSSRSTLTVCTTVSDSLSHRL